MIILRYNGDGKQHITGIPARDLDQHDLDRLIEGGLFVSVDDAIAALTVRGLYSVPKAAPKPKKSEITEEPANEADKEGDE
jgi:hypothetical protein